MISRRSLIVVVVHLTVHFASTRLAPGKRCDVAIQFSDSVADEKSVYLLEGFAARFAHSASLGGHRSNWKRTRHGRAKPSPSVLQST